jgi:hypothetical protein
VRGKLTSVWALTTRVRRRGARDDRAAERPATVAPAKELKATMVAITCRKKKQGLARLI